MEIFIITLLAIPAALFMVTIVFLLITLKKILDDYDKTYERNK